MKTYVKPELNIIEFAIQEIITESNDEVELPPVKFK